MSMLFDLADFEETRVEWVIVGDWGRCGLCGTKCAYNQGGSLTGAVCDECAQIDSCRIREHEAVIAHGQDPYLSSSARVARCLHCAWFLGSTRWEDGTAFPYTVDEVAAAMTEHVRPRHTSHWGVSHEIADHDGLVRSQAKRRAAYLAKDAS